MIRDLVIYPVTLCLNRSATRTYVRICEVNLEDVDTFGSQHYLSKGHKVETHYFYAKQLLDIGNHYPNRCNIPHLAKSAPKTKKTTLIISHID